MIALCLTTPTQNDAVMFCFLCIEKYSLVGCGAPRQPGSSLVLNNSDRPANATSSWSITTPDIKDLISNLHLIIQWNPNPPFGVSAKPNRPARADHPQPQSRPSKRIFTLKARPISHRLRAFWFGTTIYMQKSFSMLHLFKRCEDFHHQCYQMEGLWLLVNNEIYSIFSCFSQNCFLNSWYNFFLLKNSLQL